VHPIATTNTHPTKASKNLLGDEPLRPSREVNGVVATNESEKQHNPTGIMQHDSFMHLSPTIVAIDGPAASGKSTVGFQLAALSGFLYFDTGVMYRAITWGVLNAVIDPNELAKVGAFAEKCAIDILPPQPDENDGRPNTIMVDNHDVTWQIRMPEVDRNVSVIAANGAVREALTGQQRRIAHRYGTGGAEKPGVVMIGRDIGTVVVPEAPLKIYLDATPEVRARRRCEEQLDRGKVADYEQILADIYRRDQLDSERALAPLRPANDAIILDTSVLDIDEVVGRILILGMQ